MRQQIKRIVLNSKIARGIWYWLQEKRFSNSKNYWESRYKDGGNSGHGSYGTYAAFKAEVLNTFVKENNIARVLEFGCGDGNQTKLFEFPEYIGLDVSSTAINLNKKIFDGDKTKSFFLYAPDQFIDPLGIFSSDLVLSLDVIYHLTEDDVYKTYMEHIFTSSHNYVAIYANNKESNRVNPHVKTRVFTEDIKVWFPDWDILEIIEGKPTANETIPRVDFFIFQKNVLI